jgi:hypothetical protein
VAISVDAALARWTGQIGTGGTITSGSFTPADGSLLVCCINFDQSTSVDGTDVAFSVAGGSLTWTSRADSGQQNGRAAIFTAPVVTGASMTCGVTATGQNGNRRCSAKLYVATGQHASPIGASAANGSTTNNLSAGITATGDGRIFGCATCWNALGAPTSSDTEDAAHYAGEISVLSAYKAADHVSGSQSVNFDASGAAAADWRYAVLEILAAADGGATVYNRTPLMSAIFHSPIFNSRVVR